MQKQGVIFACQVFYPDMTPTSQVFNHLFQKLAEQGWPVTVFCGFPGRMDPADVPLSRYEEWQGIRIYRCGWNLSFKKNYFYRFLTYLTFLIHVGWKLLWVGKHKIVLGVTNPPFLSLMLYLTSRLRGFRYYYILHDLYPEGLVALKRLAPESLLVKFWTLLNRFSYRHAALLPVLGRDMIPLLQKNYHLPTEKFVHLPNWSTIDISEPLPFAENPLARQLGLTEKFVVQYSGNMGLWHDLETFVKGAALLQQYENIHFLFIGGGLRRDAAEQLSHDISLSNITWLDFVPKEQLPESLSCAHVSLISLKDGLEGIAVPSKLYGILASGRPLIAQVPVHSEIAYVVEEEQCGLVVEPGNAEQLAHVIRTLMEDAPRVAQLGANAFKAYQSKYTVTQATQAFENLLEWLPEE